MPEQDRIKMKNTPATAANKRCGFKYFEYIMFVSLLFKQLTLKFVIVLSRFNEHGSNLPEKDLNGSPEP